MVFAFKIAGAKADQGASLDEVVRVTEKALANIRTMGVALSPCTVPAAGKPTFTIAEDEMEIGMGIHGERGMKREKLQTADEIAERMTLAILADLNPKAGDRFAVMVNGLGATPPEELYILYRKVHELLSARGIAVHRAYVGEYATSMEMAGASLTFFRLDDELAALLDAPAHTPFFYPDLSARRAEMSVNFDGDGCGGRHAAGGRCPGGAARDLAAAGPGFRRRRPGDHRGQNCGGAARVHRRSAGR